MAGEQDVQSSATATSKYDSVNLTLTDNDSAADYSKRTLCLTKDHNTISVGRSSKTLTKGLVASEINAYFDSPVMSRTHAVFKADLKEGIVNIYDKGSMHGTSLNGKRLTPDKKYLLHKGDVISFGIHVARGFEIFSPATVEVDYHAVKAKQPAMPKPSYQAPDYDEVSDASSEAGRSEVDGHSNAKDLAVLHEDSANARTASDHGTYSTDASSPPPDTTLMAETAKDNDNHAGHINEAADTNHSESGVGEVDGVNTSANDVGKSCGTDSSSDSEIDQDCTMYDPKHPTSEMEMDNDVRSHSHPSSQFGLYDTDDDSEDDEEDLEEEDAENEEEEEDAEKEEEDSEKKKAAGVVEVVEVVEVEDNEHIDDNEDDEHSENDSEDDSENDSENDSEDYNHRNLQMLDMIDSGSEGPEDDSLINLPRNGQMQRPPYFAPGTDLTEASFLMGEIARLMHNRENQPPPFSTAFCPFPDQPVAVADHVNNHAVCGLETENASASHGCLAPQMKEHLGTSQAASQAACGSNVLNISSILNPTPVALNPPESYEVDHSSANFLASLPPQLAPFAANDEQVAVNEPDMLATSGTVAPSCVAEPGSEIQEPAMVTPSTPKEQCLMDVIDEEEDDSDPMMSAAVWEAHKRANNKDSSSSSSSKKRKAEDMLASPVSLAAEETSTFLKAQEPEVQGQEVASVEPVAKRQATTAAIMAGRKVRHPMWSVAEKIGIAALGGAAVLGTLIYSAPVL